MSASDASAAYRCWINGGGFKLDGRTHLTGAQIRALPMPSIRDTDDLYMEVPGSEDLIVQFDEVVPVVGRRFFSVPRFINAGAPDAALGLVLGKPGVYHYATQSGRTPSSSYGYGAIVPSLCGRTTGIAYDESMLRRLFPDDLLCKWCERRAA